MMDIGLSLPTMAPGFTRSTLCDWSAGIDAGPFSSISCGERITFDNPEMMVTLGAAAALTERVRVFANLIVAPMHPPALVAKQVATLQVLSGNRLTVGVGVGGREHDYQALGAPFERRHARLDECVEEVTALLAGRPPFEGAAAVGPPLSASTHGHRDAPADAMPPEDPAPDTGAALGDIEVLVGAMGPKGLARAARWADGVSGFSLTADADEIAAAAEAARQAWTAAARSNDPRLVSGCFYVLGVDQPAETLHGFIYDYLEVFGSEAALMFSQDAAVWNPGRLHQVLDDAAKAGVDEFILVPGSVEPACLEATVEACSAWLDAS